MQVLYAGASFVGLQKTLFDNFSRTQAAAFAALNLRPALYPDGRVTVAACFLLSLITERCAPGQDGFVYSNTNSEETGAWHRGLDDVLDESNQLRRESGVPHRCHVTGLAGCDGPTPGCGAQVHPMTVGDGCEVRHSSCVLQGRVQSPALKTTLSQCQPARLFEQVVSAGSQFKLLSIS